MTSDHSCPTTKLELPLHSQPQRSDRWPADFFTEVIGCWEGDFPTREQGSYELREDWTEE